MNWIYGYEKTVIFMIREENKHPEKFMCPLSFKDITKNICHGVNTCLECFNKYYPGNRELHLLWISTQYIHYFDFDTLNNCLQKSILMPDKNQDINTVIARRKT